MEFKKLRYALLSRSVPSGAERRLMFHLTVAAPEVRGQIKRFLLKNRSIGYTAAPVIMAGKTECCIFAPNKQDSGVGTSGRLRQLKG